MRSLRFRSVLALALSCAVLASPNRVSSQDEDSESRFREPVTLHEYHPFRDRGEKNWEARREEIRQRTQLAAGLFPLPERTPLRSRRFPSVHGEGFEVAPVYFESFPGHYVTGSLFLPTGASLAKGLRNGKRPGVLCPHGHWTDGRFYDSLTRAGGRGARQQIAKGAERFWNAARNPIVARSVQLARMGCIVFVYDMIGYADSRQLVEHRRGPRPGMNGTEPGEFGFVSPQATLRLQTNFGLQTWNSVRALDFLADREGVDPDRILVTGASGGATQTMVLSAIDDRVDAAFPAVMVSTAMQGGCTCENSHYLRIAQGNIDIAAATAPRPLGLTAADDWTIELEARGHPDLAALYQQLEASDSYEAHFDTHFQHNFNHVSRAHLYDFVNHHFGLGEETPVLERDFVHLGEAQLGVWTDPAREPEGYLVGEEHEKALNAAWAESSDARWREAKAKAERDDAGEIESWVRRGWEVILRHEEFDEGEYGFELEQKSKADGVVKMSGRIGKTGNEDSVAAVIHYPEDWSGEVEIRLDDAGTLESVEADGTAVITLDLYGIEDESARNDPTTYSGKGDPPADSWQRSPVYFYGYNDSVWVRRVHDVVAAVRMAEQHPDWDVVRISVTAKGPLATVALGAGVLAGGAIDELRTDPGEFRFGSVDDNWDDFMVPGALRYGDVDGLRLAAEAARAGRGN